MAAETGARAAVWGFSAGAHAALLAASLPGPVSAVVSDGAFIDLVKVVRAEVVRRSHLPRPTFGLLRPAITLMAGAPPVDLSCRLQADDYPVRTLIIHAGRDDIIASRTPAVLARVTGGQAWEIPGAAHTQGYRVAADAYFARVQRLLYDVAGSPVPDVRGAMRDPTRS
jgi:dienelactone hydrolase